MPFRTGPTSAHKTCRMRHLAAGDNGTVHDLHRSWRWNQSPLLVPCKNNWRDGAETFGSCFHLRNSRRREDRSVFREHRSCFKDDCCLFCPWNAVEACSCTVSSHAKSLALSGLQCGCLECILRICAEPRGMQRACNTFASMVAHDKVFEASWRGGRLGRGVYQEEVQKWLGQRQSRRTSSLLQARRRTGQNTNPFRYCLEEKQTMWGKLLTWTTQLLVFLHSICQERHTDWSRSWNHHWDNNWSWPGGPSCTLHLWNFHPGLCSGWWRNWSCSGKYCCELGIFMYFHIHQDETTNIKIIKEC